MSDGIPQLVTLNHAAKLLKMRGAEVLAAWKERAWPVYRIHLEGRRALCRLREDDVLTLLEESAQRGRHRPHEKQLWEHLKRDLGITPARRGRGPSTPRAGHASHGRNA